MSMDEVEELRESCGGICLSCGDVKTSGIEPDARRYICDECGDREVYGIEQAILEELISISE